MNGDTTIDPDRERAVDGGTTPLRTSGSGTKGVEDGGSPSTELVRVRVKDVVKISRKELPRIRWDATGVTGVMGVTGVTGTEPSTEEDEEHTDVLSGRALREGEAKVGTPCSSPPVKDV